MKRALTYAAAVGLVCGMLGGCPPVAPHVPPPAFPELPAPDPPEPVPPAAPAPAPPVPEEPPHTQVVLVIFHNGVGPMCLQALAWLEQAQAEHSHLVVEEHLTTEPAGVALFHQMRAQYTHSQGLSTIFAYLPVIFLEDQAFSGFNRQIQAQLEVLIRGTDPP